MNGMTEAEIRERIAANEREIAAADEERRRVDRLKPMRDAHPFTLAAVKDQPIDWAEAVVALEAALDLARSEARRA